MIEFKPFAGIRPAKSKAKLITTKNRDSYSNNELKEILENNPESFLNIINPIYEYSEWSDEEKNNEVRKKLEEFINEELLLRDRKSYYIYEQEDAEGNTTIGIIGLVAIDDVKNNNIKKHHYTIKEREDALFSQFKSLNIQTDPVMLTFPENQSIELIISMTTRHSPTLEFNGSDNNIHRLWQVKDRLVVRQLKTAIEKLKSLYVADGHHRLGSLVKYADYMRKKESDFFGGEAFNYAMAILVPGNFLKIKDYNRLIKNLNGLSPSEFLSKINDVFAVIEKGEEPYFPNGKHHMSLYLDGKFYALYVNQEHRGTPIGLGELDTFLWEEHIMKPLLGIDDARTNENIAFEKGTGDINGILKMKAMVDGGEYMAAFGFYPVFINDMILVADEGKIVPPKSTYIEPKLLSALTTFDLTD